MRPLRNAAAKGGIAKNHIRGPHLREMRAAGFKVKKLVIKIGLNRLPYNSRFKFDFKDSRNSYQNLSIALRKHTNIAFATGT